MRRFIPALLILLAAILWSTDAIVRERVFGGGAARTVAFIEHILAFSVISPLLFQSRHSRYMPMTRREWLLFLLVGVGGSAFAGTLFTLGVQDLGSSFASVFPFMQPLFVLGIATLFLRERSSSAFYFAAIWVIANAVVLGLPSIRAEFAGEMAGKTGGEFWRGIALVSFATFIWAGTTVGGKALLKEFSPTVLLVWRFGIAAFFLFASLILIPEPVSLHDLLSDRGLAAVLYFGIVTQVLAFWLYYRGLRSLPVRVATFLELLYPILGVFIPLWVSGESASPFQVFGSATLLISIGILMALEYPKVISPSEPRP